MEKIIQKISYRKYNKEIIGSIKYTVGRRCNYKKNATFCNKVLHFSVHLYYRQTRKLLNP